MTEARRRRGRDTERHVATFLTGHGFPYAKPTGAGRSGCDVTGTPGVALEVKARAAFHPLEWLKQAAGRPGLPIVVVRCNGQGPDAGQYAALLRFDQLVGLLREAGYGSPTASTFDLPAVDGTEDA